MSHRGGNISSSQQRVNCAVAVVVTHARKVLFGRRRQAVATSNGSFPEVGWRSANHRSRQRGAKCLKKRACCCGRCTLLGPPATFFRRIIIHYRCILRQNASTAGSLAETEQEKCHGWEWRYWADVTDKLFLPLGLLKQTEYRPFFSKAQGPSFDLDFLHKFYGLSSIN